MAKKDNLSSLWLPFQIVSWQSLFIFMKNVMPHMYAKWIFKVELSFFGAKCHHISPHNEIDLQSKKFSLGEWGGSKWGVVLNSHDIVLIYMERYGNRYVRILISFKKCHSKSLDFLKRNKEMHRNYLIESIFVFDPGVKI